MGMALTLSFEIRDGYIRCITLGEVRTLDDALERSRALLHKSLDTHLARFLLDDTQLRLTLEAHDIAMVGQWIDEHNAQTLGGRLAVLYNPECEANFRMCETIYQNRSLSYRVFEDEESAVAWLLR